MLAAHFDSRHTERRHYR